MKNQQKKFNFFQAKTKQMLTLKLLRSYITYIAMNIEDAISDFMLHNEFIDNSVPLCATADLSHWFGFPPI